jgi:hypothetical protein
MPDISDFDERMRDGHFEAKWTGRPQVIYPEAEAPPPPPPPPDPDTTIGTVTISGETSVNTGDSKVYTASIDGDATGLTYQWQNTGGNEVSSSGSSYGVEWDTETTGYVMCRVTSSDENCADSPADAVALEVSVVTVFSTEGGEKLTDEDGNPIAPE